MARAACTGQRFGGFLSRAMALRERYADASCDVQAVVAGASTL